MGNWQTKEPARHLKKESEEIRITKPLGHHPAVPLDVKIVPHEKFTGHIKNKLGGRGSVFLEPENAYLFLRIERYQGCEKAIAVEILCNEAKVWIDAEDYALLQIKCIRSRHVNRWDFIEARTRDGELDFSYYYSDEPVM